MDALHCADCARHRSGLKWIVSTVVISTALTSRVFRRRSTQGSQELVRFCMLSLVGRKLEANMMANVMPSVCGRYLCALDRCLPVVNEDSGSQAEAWKMRRRDFWPRKPLVPVAIRRTSRRSDGRIVQICHFRPPKATTNSGRDQCRRDGDLRVLTWLPSTHPPICFRSVPRVSSCLCFLPPCSDVVAVVRRPRE